MKIIQNYINGTWKNSTGTEDLYNRNPSDTNEILTQTKLSTEEDLNEAVTAATAAFSSWKKVPAPERGEFLFKIADLMEKEREDLALTISKEMGKTLSAAHGEVTASINHFKFHAGEGRRLTGSIIPADQPGVDVQVRKEPLGPVLIITPWNFPLVIPTWKIAPALVTGNTVVFKPSSQTPLVGQMFMNILDKAGIPKGVVNFTVASGKTFNNIIKHKDIKAVSFTGSNPVGKHVYEQASNDMKRVLLELGGKNPLIVLEDADIDRAVELAASGGFGNTGQSCTGTGRVIILSSVIDEFTEKLIEKAKKFNVGPPLKENIDMGPQSSASELESSLEHIRSAREDGADVVYGGDTVNTSECEHGYFIEPTIISNVTPSMRIAKEEVFGPVISIIEAEDIFDAISIANDVDYGLSAALCTQNIDNITYATNELEAGMVKINLPTNGNFPQVPFGGYKESSTGTYKEQGREGLDFYSREKTVYIKSNQISE